jgi:hypothetical protein
MKTDWDILSPRGTVFGTLLINWPLDILGLVVCFLSIRKI